MGKLGNIIIHNKHHLKVMPRNNIYIGRGSALGNPFTVEQFGREMAIAQYETWLDQEIESEDPAILEALDNIANKVLRGEDVNLVCFCKPKKCHGDHIKYVVNKVIAEMKP